MVRNLALAVNIFEEGGSVRTTRSQQIVVAHPLNRRWTLLAVLKAQQRQCPVRIPAPARGEDGRIQRRLFQNRLHRRRLQEIEDVSQRETVLLRQGNV